MEVKRQRLSDESLNDKGYVVLNDGLDWRRYNKNPVLFWNHDPEASLGKVKNIHREDDGNWYGELEFDGVTELSREKRDQYLAGTLRAVSISGKIYYTLKDEIKYATRFKVYEISLVSLPSNENAVAEFDGDISAVSVGFNVEASEELESLSSSYSESLTNYLKKMEKEIQPAEQPEKTPAENPDLQVQTQEQFAAEDTAESPEDVELNMSKYDQFKEGFQKWLDDSLRLFGIKGAEDITADTDMREEDRKAAEEVRDAENDDDDDDDDDKDDDDRKEDESFASTVTTEIPKPAARILDVAKTVEQFNNKPNIQFNSAMERKTIHEYLRDPMGKEKFSELTRFSAALGNMDPKVAESDSRMNLVREFVHFAAKDRGFRATMGDMTFDVNGMQTGTLNDTLNKLEGFASGINSMNFIETTPDLAKIEWSTMIYRELFPDDSWADRIPKLSAEDVAGVIWVNSAIKPKVYFGKRAPLNVGPSLYDDDPVGIIMYLFALENIVWQQANTDLLAYDDVALGTSEALRALRSKVHNYYLQRLSEQASVYIPTTGTATYSATNAFPANPGATGTLKEIAAADFYALQTEFINQNYVLETFDAEMVVPAKFQQQIQNNATLTNSLTKNAGAVRPSYAEVGGFAINPRSVTSLYNTATNTIVDPELYLDGKIADATGAIPTYTPPVIPATAYGTALGFLPSEVIIGIGRTNVHMVTDPSNYGWRMSMDFRTGVGAGRKGGLGIGVIYPGVSA